MSNKKNLVYGIIHGQNIKKHYTLVQPTIHKELWHKVPNIITIKLCISLLKFGCMLLFTFQQNRT